MVGGEGREDCAGYLANLQNSQTRRQQSSVDGVRLAAPTSKPSVTQDSPHVPPAVIRRLWAGSADPLEKSPPTLTQRPPLGPPHPLGQREGEGAHIWRFPGEAGGCLSMESEKAEVGRRTGWTCHEQTGSGGGGLGGAQLKTTGVGPVPSTQVTSESGKLWQGGGWSREPLPLVWSLFSVITFHYLALPWGLHFPVSLFSSPVHPWQGVMVERLGSGRLLIKGRKRGEWWGRRPWSGRHSPEAMVP